MKGPTPARTTSPPVGARTSASARLRAVAAFAGAAPSDEEQRRAPASGPSRKGTARPPRRAGSWPSPPCGTRATGAQRDQRGAARAGRGTLPPVRGGRTCTVPARGAPHITPMRGSAGAATAADQPFGRLLSADGVDRAREGARARGRGRLHRHRRAPDAGGAARTRGPARLLHAGVHQLHPRAGGAPRARAAVRRRPARDRHPLAEVPARARSRVGRARGRASRHRTSRARRSRACARGPPTPCRPGRRSS